MNFDIFMLESVTCREHNEFRRSFKSILMMMTKDGIQVNGEYIVKKITD